MRTSGLIYLEISGRDAPLLHRWWTREYGVIFLKKIFAALSFTLVVSIENANLGPL